MDESTARAIVCAVAQDVAGALVRYGRRMCDLARFTLRAVIADRQAERCRAAGASLKAGARRAGKFGQDYTRRILDAGSRRAYRAAAKHGQCAFGAWVVVCELTYTQQAA